MRQDETPPCFPIRHNFQTTIWNLKNIVTVSLVTGMKLLRNWISDVLVSNLPAIHLTNLSGTSVFSNFKKITSAIFVYLSITAT
jgi:hypothetical protein